MPRLTDHCSIVTCDCDTPSPVGVTMGKGYDVYSIRLMGDFEKIQLPEVPSIKNERLSAKIDQLIVR